jgi:predicted transcriptional regulator
MPASTTLTVRLSAQTKKQLGRLATHTKRTRSYLAGEAIANFVEQELAIVEGIKRGLDDMRAGRVVPHKAAMRRLRATVARVAREKM